MTANETTSSEAPPQPAREGPLPGARMALVLLLAINLFNYIDRYVLAAVEPKIEAEFFPRVAPSAAGEAEPPSPVDKLVQFKMGLLMAAFMTSYMIGSPIFGWLADRMSRWLLIGIGVTLWTLASGASGLAPAFLALLITRCFVGIGEAAYGPAAPTVISDLYPRSIRARVLSWFYMAIPVGSALGFVLGGTVEGLTHDWRWSFYVVVPPGLVLGLFCFFMRDPRRGQADAVGKSRMAGIKDWVVFLRTPSYVLNTLGMAAMTFAAGGMAAWIPRYIHTYRGAGNLDTVNQIFGMIVVVSGFVATMLGGLLGDRLQRRLSGAYFLVSGIPMLFAFPVILLVLITPFPLAYVFIFLAVFCLYFNTGPTNAILANVTHPAIRSSAFALNIFAIHALGDVISPPLIGLISDAYDMNVGFGVVSVVTLLGGVLWIWGARYLQRDTELALTRLAEIH